MYRRKSIELYIQTLRAYPEPKLNIESKMNEVAALRIISERHLLDALNIYKVYVRNNCKNQHLLSTHLENVNRLYRSVEEDLESLETKR